MFGGKARSWSYSSSALQTFVDKPVILDDAISLTASYSNTSADVIMLDCQCSNLERGEAAAEPLQPAPTAQTGQKDSIAFAISTGSPSKIDQIIFHSQPIDRMVSVASEPAGSNSMTDVQPYLSTGLCEDATGVWNEASIAAGLEGNTELCRAVLLLYQRSTLMPGGHLDLEATYAEHALRHSDSGSSFHTRSWLILCWLACNPGFIFSDAHICLNLRCPFPAESDTQHCCQLPP
jgi:hypothetical protein